MALATPTSNAVSFNITANTNQLDLSSELAELIRTDNTTFLSRIGETKRATQTRHYWDEDSLVSNKATASGTFGGGAADTSGTSLTVTTGQGKRFKVGTIFRDEARSQLEVMRVSAVSTDTLTVTRGYGGTQAMGHASGFSILIIAHTNQEDQDMDSDDTQERSSVNNLLQIFQRGVRIPYTREKIDNNGIASEFAHQVAYRMKEEMRALDSSIINGVKSASAGSNTDYRSMGGLIQFTYNTGGNFSYTAANVTPTLVNDMAEDIINDAGTIENGFLLCSPKLRRVISQFDQAYRTSRHDDTVAGFYIEQFVTDMGFNLDIIQDPWCPNDAIVIGDLNDVKLIALQNDEMRFEELAKLGRSYRGQITGQYSLEVRNALTKFAVRKNLA